VTGRNPVLIVCRSGTCNSWSFRVRDNIRLLGHVTTRTALDSLAGWTTFLGRKVGDDPDCVEEVTDANGTGEEEEIQEKARTGQYNKYVLASA
jgi:hypothetical protein